MLGKLLETEWVICLELCKLVGRSDVVVSAMQLARTGRYYGSVWLVPAGSCAGGLLPCSKSSSSIRGFEFK